MTSVEFILNADGELVAAMTWGVYTFTAPLPDTYGEWSKPMQQRYIARKVYPQLLYLCNKAREVIIAQDLRFN